MPTVYIETYGCQMNVADTELMLGHLAAHGYHRTGAPDDADVILLNTCAIREHAEARVLGRLGELARHKRRRPDVRLGDGDRAEFVFISYWNALEDVTAFAGTDIAVARFFAEDDAYLIERDLTVAHYDVAAGAPTT